MKKIEKQRLVIDLQELIEDQVYRKLMDIHWERLEKFKDEIYTKIDRDSRFVAGIVAKEILGKIDEQQKDKETSE